MILFFRNWPVGLYILFVWLWLAGVVVFWCVEDASPAPPAKPETLTCVRVKEVTPAGTINYLCEVRK